MKTRQCDIRNEKAVGSENGRCSVFLLPIGFAALIGLLALGFGQWAAAGSNGDDTGKNAYLTKAKAARSVEDHELAQFHYLAALNAFPGDSEIAMEYAEFVEGIAQDLEKKGKEADAAGRLREAVAVLRAQALLASPSDVVRLVDRAKKLQARADALFEHVRQRGAAAEDHDAQRSLKELQRIAGMPSFPAEAAALKERLERIQELQARVAAGGETIDAATQAKIDAYVGTLRTLVTLDALEARCLEYLKKAEAEKDPTAAVMLLQVAESVVRDMVSTFAGGPAIPESWRGHYTAAATSIMDELQRIGREKNALEQEQIDEATWQRFYQSITPDLEAVRSWKPPVDAESTDDKAFTKQIRKVSELNRRIAVVAGQLRDESVAEKARKLMSELSEKLAELVQQRQRRYDLWAMGEMEKAWSKFEKAKGTFNDQEEAIGKALVDHLGPVDIRLLSYEIARVYQDAMDRMLSELDAGKPGNVQPDTKIGALTLMFQMTKRSLNDF